MVKFCAKKNPNPKIRAILFWYKALVQNAFSKPLQVLDLQRF
ncbi:Unknown protein sequence [Pseudomonas amygdali pv. lachrymans]|nr:Unknown protein sequence [Pseudomonas amygdali pv. lachrymans]